MKLIYKYSEREFIDAMNQVVGWNLVKQSKKVLSEKY